MSDPTLSLEEQDFLDSLKAEFPTDLESTSGISSVDPALEIKRIKGFPNRQYPLFSTPLVMVYLKGVTTLNNSDSDSDLLTDALKYSLVRPFGALDTMALAKSQAKWLSIDSNRASLYTLEGKPFHLALVQVAIDSGKSPVKEKCLDKLRAIALVRAYLDDRSEFLDSINCPTPAEYLASKGSKSLTIPIVTKDLLDLDW